MCYTCWGSNPQLWSPLTEQLKSFAFCILVIDAWTISYVISEISIFSHHLWYHRIKISDWEKFASSQELKWVFFYFSLKRERHRAPTSFQSAFSTDLGFVPPLLHFMHTHSFLRFLRSTHSFICFPHHECKQKARKQIRNKWESNVLCSVMETFEISISRLKWS